MRRQVAFAVLAVAAAPRVAAQAVVGPTKAGDTLIAIARTFCPPNDLQCLHDRMQAIYRANPEAFAGSMSALRLGVRLKIPGTNSPSPLPLREGSGGGVAAIPGATSASKGAPAQPCNAPRPAPLQARADSCPPVAPMPRPLPGREDSQRAVLAKREPSPLREGVGGGVSASTINQQDLRRRAGEPVVTPQPTFPPLPDPNHRSNLAAVAPPKDPWTAKDTAAPITDRWRLLDQLGLIHEHWYDPYHQNTLKADKPVRNGDEFFELSVIPDLVYEYRRFPIPVGAQGTTDPGSLDLFGGSRSMLWNANLIVSAVYYKGDTTFKPPEYEFHFTPVFNINYAGTEEAGALYTNPDRGRYRQDQWIGVQELFADYHLRNVSDRYDFDSIRAGIQPFSSDFRGFLFQDQEPSVRLFGNRDNNRWQYNLVWIRRLEKNTNSGLNDITQTPRNDDVYLFNLYHQDWPVLGFTSQGIIAHNRNREDGADYYDDNGFLVRPAAFGTELPRKYEVTYLGYNGDGHFGRLNLTASTYLVEGNQNHGDFSNQAERIQAIFGAWEASMDFDWLRIRQSAIYQSGDHNPYNHKATGFDAIYENPLIAGADTSFWIRQAVPLIGGGGVALSQRNGVLVDLRSSKDLGQSNFENPGLWLLGVGADADLLPTLRLSGNFNHLWFDDPAVLEVARNQGSINRSIGWDLSTALIWRPRFSQNIVARLSGAMLLPGEGYRDLFPDKTAYSVLANVTLAY